MIESDPVGAIAVWILGLLALAFYMWQSYKLQQVLADRDHPEHDVAKDAVTESFESDWDWWGRP